MMNDESSWAVGEGPLLDRVSSGESGATAEYELEGSDSLEGPFRVLAREQAVSEVEEMEDVQRLFQVPPSTQCLLLISGGPGLYDARDKEHDASWANYVTAPLLLQKNKALVKPGETVHWLVYKPAYEARWKDDWKNDRKSVTEVRCDGFASYVDMIEKRAQQNGWTLKWLFSNVALWAELAALPAPITRVLYWGHAVDKTLWLSLGRDASGRPVAPDASAQVPYGSIQTSLKKKFAASGVEHRFVGCNTASFAQAWSTAFGGCAEGVIGRVNFGGIVQTGEPSLSPGATRVKYCDGVQREMEGPFGALEAGSAELQIDSYGETELYGGPAPSNFEMELGLHAAGALHGGREEQERHGLCAACARPVCRQCGSRAVVEAAPGTNMTVSVERSRRALYADAIARSETEEEFLATVDPVAMIFDQVIQNNLQVSSPIAIPSAPVDWVSRVKQYASSSVTDGPVLAAALRRAPTFHRGGWILALQPMAGAMTLDNRIFVRANLNLSTFVHELVHVFQYGTLGATAFLSSYFGLSGATIAYRFARRVPLNVMQSSPHEMHAYAVERRFAAWHQSNFGASPASIVA
jgi:hypothetical protein